MKRLVLASLAALSLAACATAPTVYQPAATPGGVGYSEFRIEQDRYRVTFRGGPGAPPERVMDLALVRAADLALANGYDWFRVSDRLVRQVGVGMASGPDVGFGFGGASFGSHGGGMVGLGAGLNFSGKPEIAATLEVLFGRGPKPEGLDVYDARAVRGALGHST